MSWRLSVCLGKKRSFGNAMRLVLVAAIGVMHSMVFAADSLSPTGDDRPLKVLMVGNSFSRSVIWETPSCAKSVGRTLDLVSLHVGGCTLKKHACYLEIAATNNAFCPYRLEWRYGSVSDRRKAAVARLGSKVNLQMVLRADRWDVVTIQQASWESMDASTYQPFADRLVANIRKSAPQAEIMIQQTWSYTPYDARLFKSKTTPFDMYRRLAPAYDRFARQGGFRLIPTGLAVQLFRERLPVEYGPLPTAEELKGCIEDRTVDFHGDVCGDNEYRDMTHLNGRGNYLQACVWTAALFDVDPTTITYRPRGIPENEARLMRKCAREAVWQKTGATLQGEGVAVRFGGAADGYGIRTIENRMAGGTHFSASDGRKADFWRLVFTADGGRDMTKAARLDNLTPCRDRRVERTADGLAFHWLGLTVPGGEEGAVDVRADVRLSNGDETEWRLSVTNRDRKWVLFETHYPCVRQMVPDGTADVLTPGRNLGGRLVRKFDSRKEWRNRWGYPGLYPMVTAFMLGDAGLYVAAHDGEARIKTLSLAPGCDLSFQTVVENAGVPGKAVEGPRYPVVIAAFRGDWWQAARRYRDWARKQRWCAKGRIVNRKDWPKAMTDVDAWLLSCQCSAENLRKRICKVKTFYPDMKICVHWYGWNSETPNLGECPYFSPGPDVRETVDFMRSKDILLMPYVDGRLQSKASARFETALAEACRTVAGGLEEETWGKASYVVMCPTAPQFGKIVLDTATNIVLGCGFGAVYEDQIACSRAVPCFDSAHGHPLGGGTWWTDGYRTILTSMHETLAAKNRPITSEGACEVWLDLIDGYLQAETPKGDDVPFYPVVYGGYAVYFGARMKYEIPQAFFTLQARALAWGVAPNWQRISDDFVENRLPGAIEILRRVARVRKAAADFLKYGSLEDGLRPLETAGVRHIEWLGADGDQCGKRFSADMPEVFGTVWRDASGSRSAVFAVNICDTPRTIRFKSIFSNHPELLAVEGENMAEMNADGDVLSLKLPPLGMAVLTGSSVVTK